MLPLAIMDTHWDKGRRDYYFPPLPVALTKAQQMEICRQWVEAELVSRGMACEINLYRTDTQGSLEPVFSCTIRPFGPDGFGERVEEWGTAAFFSYLKRSFASTVNDALHENGFARSYDML